MCNPHLLFRRWRIALCVLGSVLLSSWLLACQVPVFRYAIERWHSDHYEILVLNQGPLSIDARKPFDVIKEAVQPNNNATVRFLDLTLKKDPLLERIWKQNKETGPLLAILYPQAAHELPDRLLQTHPLEGWSKDVLDSPIRRELAKRLLEGQSAVWIFLPIGNVERDESALLELQSELEKCREQLKLPTVEDLASESAKVQEEVLKMKVEFSVLPVKRDDPNESFLVRSLLQSEADLAELKEPMAFPVFGRGRVLYALIGNGINAEMVRGACKFIVGPCSCQVKAQNPGFDLLMNVDWEHSLGDSLISDPLPDETKEPVLLKIPSGKGP
jgi:hypothetical protein